MAMLFDEEQTLRMYIRSKKGKAGAKPPKIRIRDSVFSMMMKDEELRFGVYKSLHPEDVNTKASDVQLISLTQVLTDRMYNDAGLLVGDRLIILCEAQTKWDENAAARYLLYAVQTIHDYLLKTKQNLHGDKVKIPFIEFFMLFTGSRRNVPNEISFAEEFEQENIDLRIKLLRSGLECGDTVDQFFMFSDEYENAVRLHGRTHDALIELHRICTEKNILTKLMSSLESEVYTMMMAIFDQDRATLAYGDKRAKEAEARGEARGIPIGRIEGTFNTLFGLVKDGLLSLDIAAQRAKTNSGDFKAKMDAWLAVQATA